MQKKKFKSFAAMLFMYIFLFQSLAVFAKDFSGLEVKGNKTAKDEVGQKALSGNNSNWIYYSTQHYYKTLRINTDGKSLLNIKDLPRKYQIVGDYVYYVSESDNKLYKRKIDNTSSTVLVNGDVEDFQITKNYIFYASLSEKKLYRITLDGKGKTLVIKEEMYKFQTTSAEIIYTDYKNLYKTSLDGKNKKIIIKGYCNNIYVQGSYVYYNNDKGFYRSTLDGKKTNKIDSEAVNDYKIYGNYIYYQSQEDWNIYVITVDGKGKKKISDKQVLHYQVYKNCLFYIGEDLGLYKANLDGTKRAKLDDASDSVFTFIEDYVYYINGKDNFKLYRIKFDKTSKQKLSNEILANISIRKMEVIKNSLYLLSENSCIPYKVSADGKNNIKINNDCTRSPILKNDILYFQDDNLSVYSIKDGQKSKIIDRAEDYVIKDKYIYYKSDFKLYRTDLNGKNKVTVFEEKGHFELNSVVSCDNLVYFKCSYTESYESNLVVKDLSTGKTKLIAKGKASDGGILKFIVDGDKIYYSVMSDDNESYTCLLYRSELDGSNPVKLTEKADKWYAAGEYIVCCNSGEVFRMKKDGSDIKKLSQENLEAQNVFVDEDNKYIYYTTLDWNLYRVDIDGKDNKLMFNSTVSSEYLQKGELYYIGSENLCKLDASGKNVVLVKNVSVYKMYDNYICYVSSKDNKLYKVDKDGKNNIKLSDEYIYCIIGEDGNAENYY